MTCIEEERVDGNYFDYVPLKMHPICRNLEKIVHKKTKLTFVPTKGTNSRNKSRGFRLEFSNGMLFFGPFPTECLNAHVYCTRKRPAKTPLITFRREFHTIMAIATPVVLPHLRCNGRKIRVCFFLKMSKHAQGWVLWFNWRKKVFPIFLLIWDE